MKSLFALLFLVSVLACNKNRKEDPKPAADGLPQPKDGQVVALVNGKAAMMPGRALIIDHSQSSQSHPYRYKIQIEGNSLDTSIHRVLIQIDSQKILGSYNDRSVAPFDISYTRRNVVMSTLEDYQTYQCSPLVGKLAITGYDSLPERISGTFEAELCERETGKRMITIKGAFKNIQ